MKILISILVIIACFFLTAENKITIVSEPENKPIVLSLSYPSDSSELLRLTNYSRVENGTYQLKFNDKLNEAAKEKAKDMFEHNYFKHDSPTGIEPWDWIRGAGYDYKYAGENLAIRFKNIENAHTALMESPLHKKNIVNPKFDEIGIAIIEGEFNNEQTIIIVEMFGKLGIKAEKAKEKMLNKSCDN